MLSGMCSGLHVPKLIWSSPQGSGMFGPVHAQTAVELAIGFGSVHAQTAVQHELLEQNCYSTLELALAVKSRSIGAHSDNRLAEGGSEEE